ncbi:hypothetical protein AB0L53_42605 [Nonomuraea sp. NPDC052129]|uniref:NACHT domain-containing protein n=1 Tax=Nonomuraea sp. NPDC052129 TaxID=3154651 RepID=UPI0034139D8C
MTQELLNQITWTLSAIATVAALISLRFDAFTHAHGREEAFRRISGRTFSVLGLLLIGFGLYIWLTAAGVPPRAWPGLTPWVASGIGCAVFILGAVRVARTGPETYVDQLRYISKTVVERLGEPVQVTEPLITIEKRFRRRRPVSRELLRSDAKVTFILGEAGSGRTLALRKAVWRTRRHILNTKKPRRIALYVDLAALAVPVTADVIRSHIYRFVADGNSIIEDDLRRLLTERRKLRWVFLFDGFDTAESRETLLKAIRQFTDSGPTFRAVVVIQDEPDMLAGEDILRVSPLTYAQQQDIATRRGIADSALFGLFTHLAEHPDLARRAANPLFLQLLCDYVRRAGAEHFPSTSYELLEAAVAERLAAVDGSLQAAEVAEALAAHAIEPDLTAGTESPAPATVQALTAAGLIHAYRNGSAVFASRMFRDYFAARWLVRMRGSLDPRPLITTPVWRDSVALCLGLHQGELREKLITAAREVLDEQMTKAEWGIEDVTPYLAAPPNAPTATAPSGLAWPAPMRHVLDLLNRVEGNVPEFAQLTPLIDRIVVSAFVRGRPAEQNRALALLPLASPEVGAWAVTRLVRANRSDELVLDAAEQLSASPETFLRLPGHVRLLLVGRVLQSPPLVTLLVPRARIRLHDDVLGLAAIIRATMRLLQAWAVVSIVQIGGQLVTHLSEWWFWTPLLLVCAFFLYGSGLQLRTISRQAYTAAFIPALAGLILTIATTVLAVHAAVSLLMGEVGTAALEMFRAAADTWPVALVVYMGWTGRLPQDVRDWVLPHLRPLRDLFNQYVASRDPNLILRGVQRNLVQSIDIATVLRWFNRGLCLTLVLVVLGLPIELPNVTPDQQTAARGAVAVGLIIVGFFIGNVLSKWQRNIKRRRVIGRVASGHLTAEELLAMLDRAGRADFPGKPGTGTRNWAMPETDFLAKTLATCPPESLKHVMDVLRDLDAALGHIAWMVDKNSTDPIARGVWESVPQLRHPALLLSLIQYDKRYPGQLERLADAHHDRIRQITERASQS